MVIQNNLGKKNGILKDNEFSHFGAALLKLGVAEILAKLNIWLCLEYIRTCVKELSSNKFPL